MILKILNSLFLVCIAIILLCFLLEFRVLTRVVLERQNLNDRQLIDFKRNLRVWELRLNGQSMIINNYLDQMDCKLRGE